MKTPVGLPLEIVPLSNPTGWKIGDKAEFQLLENGQPLAGIALGLIGEANSKRIFLMTDNDGRAAFTLDKAGRALLFAVHLHPRDDRGATLLLPLLAVAVFFMLNIGSRTAAQDRKQSAPNSGRQTIQTGYAPVNGLKIYYEIHGTAKPRRPPLVLLHGGGDTIGTSFGRVLPVLRATGRSSRSSNKAMVTRRTS
jgi:Domain of unknown function (DUF4198)